jgi:formamidopyrimidine-DNA glycosylase
VPELPEVETTRRSLEPPLVGHRVVSAVVRDRRLRWPVPDHLEHTLTGAMIVALRRRAKYLLIDTDRGSLLVHLGMSGSLTVVPGTRAPVKHDHVDIVLDSGETLRFHDPRRFGSMHWLATHEASHPLLAELAPEPFDEVFDGAYLHRVTRGRSAAIKQVIMNGTLVTGVGNIYASEALHRAAINPRTRAGRLSRARCDRLATAIRETLGRAIELGGSSLRDYVDGHGNAGEFQSESAVYGREGLACHRCGDTIRLIRQGARATYYCAGCQR